MKNKIKQLEEELHEQCVLNGKGSEREANLLGKVERLERENAALRQALEDMPTCRCGLSTDEQCALSVENAALREDKERLDWMASADYWADIAVYRTPQALRAAIDATRKEAQP